jgi:hypothetical protein
MTTKCHRRPFRNRIGFSSGATSAKGREVVAHHRRPPRPTLCTPLHSLLHPPPHAQAPSSTEAAAGTPPHIPSKRPSTLARDARHILHRRGRRCRPRGPCCYRRTTAITNWNPSSNADRCRPPCATTSGRGTARPAHLRPPMVSAAAPSRRPPECQGPHRGKIGRGEK